MKDNPWVAVLIVATAALVGYAVFGSRKPDALPLRSAPSPAAEAAPSAATDPPTLLAMVNVGGVVNISQEMQIGYTAKDFRDVMAESRAFLKAHP